MRALRGKDIGLVFQDPTNSLNSVMTVIYQAAEAVTSHRQNMAAPVVRATATRLLNKVGLAEAETAFHRYPHEYSGGMRQRAMIAIAIANEPSIVIADEATTALDVTIQC